MSRTVRVSKAEIERAARRGLCSVEEVKPERDEDFLDENGDPQIPIHRNAEHIVRTLVGVPGMNDTVGTAILMDLGLDHFFASPGEYHGGYPAEWCRAHRVRYTVG